MKLSREISYPQVWSVPPDAPVIVPVRRVTFTIRLWRLTLSASYTARAVIPPAFRNNPGNRRAPRVPAILSVLSSKEPENS